MALSNYRESSTERANFNESLSRLEITIFKAAESYWLWQVLHDAASKNVPLRNREITFFGAAMRASATAAIVRLSSLQDDRRKDTQTLDNLLTLGKSKARIASDCTDEISHMLEEASVVRVK